MTYPICQKALSIHPISNKDTLDFNNCYPETVLLNEHGRIINETYKAPHELTTTLFRTIFNNYPVNNHYKPESDNITQIIPPPDCLTPYIIRKIDYTHTLPLDKAHIALTARLSTMSALFTWEEQESLFHSFFPHNPELADKIDFLYAAHSIKKATPKLLKFITINNLLNHYIHTKQDITIKELTTPQSEQIRTQIYHDYNNLTIEINPHTNLIADIIFAFNQKQLDEYRNNNILITPEKIRNDHPTTITYKNILENDTLPQQLRISELTQLNNKKSHLTPHPTLTTLLKHNKKIINKHKKRTYNVPTGHTVHYVNNVLLVHNLLNDYTEQQHDLTILMERTFHHYLAITQQYKCTDFSLLPALLAFTLLTHINNHHQSSISEYELHNIVTTLCVDHPITAYDHHDLHTLSSLYAHYQGKISLQLITNTTC